MEVILQERIRNLGSVGDKVAVKSGFARNYLVPAGKAVYATKQNVAEFEARRAELEKKAAELLKQAQGRAKQFAGMSLTIIRKASEEGKLYGSVGTFEVIEAFKQKGLDVHKNELDMPEGAI